MGHFSHSKLAMYETCQLKFRFAHVDKLDMPFEQTVSLAIGKTCHHTLEHLYKQTAKGHTITLDMLLAYAQTKRSSETIALTDVTDDDWALVVRHVTRYYETHAPFTQDTTIGTEVRFTLPLENGHTCTGIIDRVALSGRILKLIDYKTSHSIKTTADNEYTSQLKTYALAAHHLYPGLFDTVQCIIVYLSAQVEQVFEFDHETMTKHKQHILDRTQEIGQKMAEYSFFPDNVIFTHSPGKHCQSCPFLTLCPAWKHKDMIDEEVSVADLAPTTIKRLVDEYVIAKKHLKEQEKKVEMMADLLKKYAHHHNLLALYGQSAIVGFRATYKLTIHDKDTLSTFLKQEGIFDQLASINHATLTSFIKKNPDILRRIDKQIASWDPVLMFGKITHTEEDE